MMLYKLDNSKDRLCKSIVYITIYKCGFINLSSREVVPLNPKSGEVHSNLVHSLWARKFVLRIYSFKNVVNYVNLEDLTI